MIAKAGRDELFSKWEFEYNTERCNREKEALDVIEEHLKQLKLQEVNWESLDEKNPKKE